MSKIWVCPICDAVHDASDVDEDWETEGCPECQAQTRKD